MLENAFPVFIADVVTGESAHKKHGSDELVERAEGLSDAVHAGFEHRKVALPGELLFVVPLEVFEEELADSPVGKVRLKGAVGLGARTKFRQIEAAHRIEDELMVRRVGPRRNVDDHHALDPAGVAGGELHDYFSAHGMAEPGHGAVTKVGFGIGHRVFDHFSVAVAGGMG